MGDPIGSAIFDYYVHGEDAALTIETNYTDPEQLKAEYFFRSFDEMPAIEKAALSMCRGKILDVGAAAGCHTLYLQEKGFAVTALEKSTAAAEVMKLRDIQNVIHTELSEYHTGVFDTILVLMNGTGIGSTLSGLTSMLMHLKNLLSKDGQILIDSSDLTYLFQEEDGSMWIDLTNEHYMGEMDYTITYKNIRSEFKWLFTDYDTLRKTCLKVHLACQLVEEGSHYDYLARLSSY